MLPAAQSLMDPAEVAAERGGFAAEIIIANVEAAAAAVIGQACSLRDLAQRAPTRLGSGWRTRIAVSRAGARRRATSGSRPPEAGLELGGECPAAPPRVSERIGELEATLGASRTWSTLRERMSQVERELAALGERVLSDSADDATANTVHEPATPAEPTESSVAEAGRACKAPRGRGRTEEQPSTEGAMQGFGAALASLFLAVLLVAAVYLVARAVRVAAPEEPGSPFLSGHEPREHAFSRFHVRWYPLSMLYLAFEMEMLFMYPWALVVSTVGAAAVVEMFAFLAVLLVAVVYAWREGALRWT